MAKLEFYRGKIDSYDQSKHGQGIYFSTDTFEIIHNSQSFAFTPSKKFVEELLDGTIGDFSWDTTTGKLYYSKFTHNENGDLVEEEGLEFPVAIAGQKTHSGDFIGGADGLMSARDKYNLDTLIAGENIDGSVKNIVSSYLEWEDVKKK